MTERELNTILMNSFPELTDKLNAYIEEDGDGMDTGCFLTHEDVLHPFIDEALEANNVQLLRRIGAYTEHLLCLDDEYAENVATVGIVEWIAAERPNAAHSHNWGEKSQKLFDAYWGMSGNA